MSNGEWRIQSGEFAGDSPVVRILHSEFAIRHSTLNARSTLQRLVGCAAGAYSSSFQSIVVGRFDFANRFVSISGGV
jgi:hypothetical protein